MSPEAKRGIPDWAQRERQRDMQWIRENLHMLWPTAQRAYQEQGRGAIVVDATSQPLPDRGNPFGYFPRADLERFDDQDLMRMIGAYRPETEMVLLLLKSRERTSTYRVQPQPPM